MVVIRVIGSLRLPPPCRIAGRAAAASILGIVIGTSGGLMQESMASDLFTIPQRIDIVERKVAVIETNMLTVREYRSLQAEAEAKAEAKADKKAKEAEAKADKKAKEAEAKADKKAKEAEAKAEKMATQMQRDSDSKFIINLFVSILTPIFPYVVLMNNKGKMS